MFVCIIEGNVLPRVSFKRWRAVCVCVCTCVHVRMCNFLKIHARLGVHLPRKAFFLLTRLALFFMHQSVLAILIACAITGLLRALDLV